MLVGAELDVLVGAVVLDEAEDGVEEVDDGVVLGVPADCWVAEPQAARLTAAPNEQADRAMVRNCMILRGW